MSNIKTRKPTGSVPWPLILIEGPEKSGKSYAAAEFTASDKIGQAYWLDLGEGAADEYAAINGANYLIVEHNGTWAEIIDQVRAVHEEAARAAKVGEKPVVLVIDSMTAEWEMLKDWTSHRARNSKSGRAQLQRDPNAEIKPAMNFWNDANERHRSLMHLLMTFPGIVLITGRGREVAAMDNDGKPVIGQKDYRVEGHKNLAYDVTAWVRLSRDENPKVVGVRSIHAGLRPGVDRPRTAPSFTVEWLIFDVMKCNPANTHVREHVQTDVAELEAEAPPKAAPQEPFVEPDYQAIEEWTADATDIDALKDAWKRMNAVKTGRGKQVCDLIFERVKAIQAAPAEPEQPTLDEAAVA